MSNYRESFDPSIYGDKLPKAVVAPYNESVPGIFMITGKVTLAYPNKPWRVITKSGRVFYLKYSSFCPVRNGDIISAICADMIGDNANVIQHPIVHAPEDEDSVIKTLVTMLKKSGIGFRQCIKLYELLSAEHTRSPTENLSHISDMWHKSKNREHLYPLTDVLTPDVAIKLVIMWRKSKDTRSLYLLGFSRKDIEAFEDPLHVVYRSIMENPYTVAQVSPEMCLTVDGITGRVATDLDKYCGMVIRDIYGRMKKKSWSAVTYYWLDRRYQDLHKFKDVLTSDYGCVFTTINKYDELGNPPKATKVVYLDYSYDVEVYITDFISQRCKPYDPEDIVNGIVAGPIIDLPDQPKFDTDLDDVQMEAVAKAIKGGVSILTGGPGTGKTSTIKEIVRVLELNNIEYAMTSFTGKAVSRIKTVVGSDAQPATMHRMIYSPNKYEGFKVLICDETSMVTTKLFKQFLDVFGTDFSLVLVGDDQQLPPISYGSLFHELIKSRCVTKTVLKRNYRVVDMDDPDTKDIIVPNLERISNWPEDMPYIFMHGSNFLFLEGDERKVLDIVMAFHANDITQDRWKIVCPYNKCLAQLNAIVQAIYHGNEECVKAPNDKLFRKGDQVMCLRNDYDEDVMNGEEGVVVSISHDHIEVLFEDEKLVKVPFASADRSMFAEDDDSVSSMNTDSITLSYALTIHKVQGSEYEYVVFLMPSNANSTHTEFLNRNLIYTGISRAKRYVYHLGNSMVTSSCIANVLPYKCEYLHDRLRDKLPLLYDVEEKIELCPYGEPCEGELPPDDFWDDFDDY